MIGSESSDGLWPDADRGPWRLTRVFFPIAGRWELVGLTIEPADPDHPEPLTTTQLRMLVPSRMAAEHRADMGAWLDAIARSASMDERTRESFLRQSSAGETRKRPAYWSGQRLTEVARVYLEAWANGDRSPTKAVAEQRNISRSLAGKLVHMCRQQGLVPPVTKGRSK